MVLGGVVSVLIVAGGLSAGGAHAAVAPEAANKPAWQRLLKSVASAESAAVGWRARTRNHPFGATATGKILPVGKYRISSFFRNTDPAHSTGRHSGVDFATKAGARIASVCDGRVVRSGFMGAAGNAAIVRTADGFSVLYGHMSANFVRRGDVIHAGDPIGRIGSTGNSTGPHLHLQVTNRSGKLVDPVDFLGVSHRSVEQYGRR